ncbi:hypothetical protein Droror1_Dr00011374, partial [Drosera rotundifolia]
KPYFSLSWPHLPSPAPLSLSSAVATSPASFPPPVLNCASTEREMANVEIASGGGGRSLLGRRPESPSIDNRNTPHIEGEIPVPNLPNMLPLDGVPFGKSTSSSSSCSPCAAEETGYRPPEKPHEPSIVWYYGEPFFSGHSLSPKVLDEYWRKFKDEHSWNP